MVGTVARAHTEECCRSLEECLAQDEETSVRSEAAQQLVGGWLAGRVASTENASRSGDAAVDMPSGSAAAASSSAPAVEVPDPGDEVPDHGVKRVRCSPQVQDTKVFS